MPSRPLYQSLEPACIRLLKLHSTCPVGEPDKPQDLAITCSLQHCALADITTGKIAYRALSYVWGSPRFVKTVVCNGVETSVTANLYEALLQLVLDESFEALLWVDALCINQDDKDEKGHQVSVMDDIFKGAERVIVWLGTATGIYGADFSDYWTTMSGEPNSNRHPVRDSSVTKRLNQFEWFRRCWTYQEIILARRAEVRYGPWCVDWEVFERSAASIERIKDIASMRQSHSRGGVELSTLVVSMAKRRAAVPLDKVYAALGLWGHRDDIQVNYERRALEVRASVVEAVFRYEGWLWLQLDSIPVLMPTSPLPNMYKKDRKDPMFWPFKPKSWIPNFKDRPADQSPKARQQAAWTGPPVIQVEGSRLTVKGALIGFWLCKESAQAWQPDSNPSPWDYSETDSGNFEAFPDCMCSLGTLAMTNWTPGDHQWFESIYMKQEPMFHDSVDVYGKLCLHVQGVCSCREGSEEDGALNVVGLSRSLPNPRPWMRASRWPAERPSDKQGTNFGWLCILPHTRQLVVMVTRLDPRNESLCFGLAARMSQGDHDVAAKRCADNPYPWLSLLKHANKEVYYKTLCELKKRPQRLLDPEKTPLSLIATTFEIIGDEEEWV